MGETEAVAEAVIATILPPREMFSPLATGAIGLLVHQLARAVPGAVVYGMPAAAPFADVAFEPVALPWLPLRQVERYAAGLVRALRRRMPGLIEVHNRPDLAMHLARRFPKIPVVLFLHNDPQGMRRARTEVERLALLEAVALVAPVSGYLASRLPKAGNVTVFPNFIDLAGIPEASRDAVILFAGRVVADKGADSFVDACARALPKLPGWRAVMVGADRFGADSPETPFLAGLRPRAAAAGVELLGWLPHQQVLEAMARASLIVVPSRWPEPFGLTALEAMACGTALLCAPSGGLAEVTAGVAVPIDPEDPAGIAAEMVRLAWDPAARADLGDRGRARAERFDLPEAAARLVALRRSVLEGSKGWGAAPDPARGRAPGPLL
jgi:glycosyltransferase involved in cell wall biosynthesis